VQIAAGLLRLPDFGAQLIEDFPTLLGDIIVVVARQQGCATRVLKKAIHRRQSAQALCGLFGHEGIQICTRQRQIQLGSGRGNVSLWAKSLTSFGMTNRVNVIPGPSAGLRIDSTRNLSR
jgi:hypothetical protein